MNILALACLTYFFDDLGDDVLLWEKVRVGFPRRDKIYVHDMQICIQSPDLEHRVPYHRSRVAYYQSLVLVVRIMDYVTVVYFALNKLKILSPFILR